MSIGERITALADRLDLDDKWRDAFHAVPRHLFVPDKAWCHPDDGPGFLIGRTADPETWLDVAYSNTAIVTQIDEAPPTWHTGKATTPPRRPHQVWSQRS
ncbi:MAG TPA: hypothetical protein VM347_20930 [Nonomuraea sp.]|nr:hypothetical protein [Nonomuraea sp.]